MRIGQKEEAYIIEVRTDRINVFTAKGEFYTALTVLNVKNCHLVDNRYLYTI